MRTEAWLIEAATLSLCYAKDGSCRRWVVFTDPDAWRFDDKVSAENVIAKRGLIGVVATGHTWG